MPRRDRRPYDTRPSGTTRPLVAVGFGSTEANGNYHWGGTLNNQPLWINGATGLYLFYQLAANAFVISTTLDENYGNVLYDNEGSLDPTYTWQTDSGSDPAGTVSYA